MKYLLAVLALVAITGTATALTVKVEDTKPAGTLTVQPLPPQPELKVVQGTSTVNADGTVNWQPAGSSKLQNTFNPQR